MIYDDEEKTPGRYHENDVLIPLKGDEDDSGLDSDENDDYKPESKDNPHVYEDLLYKAFADGCLEETYRHKKEDMEALLLNVSAESFTPKTRNLIRKELAILQEAYNSVVSDKNLQRQEWVCSSCGYAITEGINFSAFKFCPLCGSSGKIVKKLRFDREFRRTLKAAEEGDADAQNSLGDMYYDGIGVQQDYDEAARWFRKAAEQGHAQAQCNLGYLYIKGQGVPQNPKKSTEWYRRAAEQGNANAQCSMGYAYSNGYGVSKDKAEAVKWYRKSADQGNVLSQYNLGMMYKTGQGVKASKTEAVKWFMKAAEQGDEEAKARLDEMLN